MHIKKSNPRNLGLGESLHHAAGGHASHAWDLNQSSGTLPGVVDELGPQAMSDLLFAGHSVLSSEECSYPELGRWGPTWVKIHARHVFGQKGLAAAGAL